MNSPNKGILGVIGGLGPVATAHFMELVIRMTRAQRDQDHLDMILYNSPSIPDRTAYILDRSKPSPLPEMIRLGRLLRDQGASCVAIPCFTAHYFYQELCDGIGLPVINALRESAEYLCRAGVRKAGIMATTGTIQTKLFHRELTAFGIEAVDPPELRQQDVMSLIYHDIKQNRKPDLDRFRRVSQDLRDRGAEVIILGCTELSLIKRDFEIGPGFLDAMEVLAAESVIACGKPLSDAGKNLIT